MALMSYSNSLNGFVATGTKISSEKVDAKDDEAMASTDTSDGETTATDDIGDGETTATEDTSDDEGTAVEETSEDETDEETTPAQDTGETNAPRPRRPLKFRSLDEEERFLKHLDPLLRSAREERCEERAVELIKVLWFDRFPESKPALGWRPDESLDSHPGWWALYLKERMRDIGLHSMFCRSHTQVQDWEVKLSLEYDRNLRREEYFSWANWGRYLTGHQYDVVISAETRRVAEISVEERMEQYLEKILEAVRGST
ncbi:hypothetical protein H0H93_011362 [Arthromyces matolae]|nr:hypothetical protein H0H93_011362 [Arthromyces matolae]